MTDRAKQTSQNVELFDYGSAEQPSVPAERMLTLFAFIEALEEHELPIVLKEVERRLLSLPPVQKEKTHKGVNR
tara:strand:- start:327 stop:548 length:222 start_codon:yes stop_codon:yes gene_type:complete